MKKGFTLIELLVAVTIFSGLVILAIGAFARSAISSERTDALRDKTQAARSVIDQIGNDFRYVYIDNNKQEHFSYSDTTKELKLTLRYPDDSLVLKTYQYDFSAGTIKVGETRCPNKLSLLGCENYPTASQVMLDPGYLVVSPTPEDVFKVVPSSATVKGYLVIAITIKPVDATQVTELSHCDANPGICYTLQTTYVIGNYQS